MTTRPSPISGSRHFFEGLAAPWRGLLFLKNHRTLWPAAVAPLLLNLLVVAGLIVLLVMTGGHLFAAMHPAIGQHWWRLPVEIVAGVLLFVASVGVLAAVWFIAQSVLCVWFYDRLARKVERLLGVAPDELKNVSLWPQTIDAIRDAFALLGVNLVCLLLQILPVVGNVLGAVGSCYFTCSTLGYAYLDYPLSLRGMRRKEKRQFIRSRRSASLGLGAGAMLLAFIPVVNAVFLTTAVVGGVLLFRGIRD
jgi:CysZ protein